MKLIRDLEEYIEDEIGDIEKYAKMAIAVKDEYPNLAQTLYTISTQEDIHQAAIHSEIVKIIQEHRKLHGEPPAAMQAIYDWQHERQIKKIAEAKRYQEIYKSS